MRSKYILIAIFTLGVLLRFFMLGGNPPSLNWDEVSSGYNAYSILKTGKDEYGNFLPLSIRSFDDYKPALYTYLTVPAVALFGLNEFAVRLPSAFLGSLTVLVVYFLTKEIFYKKTEEEITIKISLLAAFFFAISPWSLQFSRAAYEGNIGLFFLLTGVLFLFKFLRDKKYLLVSLLCFIFSLYSYHSFRLIIPLFLFGFGIIYFKEIMKQRVFVIVSLVVLVSFSVPIYSSFFLSDEGTGSRLSMVTIFADSPELQRSIERLEYDKSIGNPLGLIFENRRFVYALAATRGYLEHFNPGYLFMYGDGGVQHHAVDFGMLYVFTLPFILIGAYFLCRNFSKRIGVLFFLFALAPLASAISSGAPHPVRAIIMAPIFDIFTAIGVVFVAQRISGLRLKILQINVKFLVFSVCVLFFVLNFLYYLNQYYIHTPREYGYFWQYGNKEAVEYINKNKAEYEKIIMTYEYDQPYIFYLFYNKIDPSWYQKNWDFTGDGVMPRFERRIGNITFRDISFGEDSKSERTLLIGTPSEIPEDADVVSEIAFPDGSVAYRIVRVN